MQVRQPGRYRTPVPATSHHQYTYLALQQFWVNMVRFHGFMVLPFLHKLLQRLVRIGKKLDWKPAISPCNFDQSPRNPPRWVVR